MVVIKKIIFWCFFFLFISAGNALATCTVTSSSYYLAPNSDVDIAVNLNNTGTEPITWFKIPNNYSSVLTVNTQTLQESGWTLEEPGDSYIYSGGSILPNESVHLNLTIHSSDDRAMGLTWFASPNTNGDPTENCSDLNIEITSSPPVAPTIQNTNLAIGNSSATLTWSTNSDATGKVNYGTSAGYGSSTTTASSTSHSAILSGLSASTTYHYQIQVTGTGGTTTTNDATFTTSAADVTITTTTTVTNTVVNTVTNTIQNTITKILSDTTPPTINITTDFSKTLKESGEVTGKATDTGLVNAGVSSLEYSIDGGKNWLPISDITTPNSKKTDFSFFPNIKDDGNYIIKVRAKDLSGNTGISKPHTLIIDRLPPMVGGVIYLSGSLILHPNSGGKIYTISGLPVDITLSAVGGPLSIDILSGSEKFALKKNTESGLWHTQILLKTEGGYKLKVKSLDGGKNETEKELNVLEVLATGKVIDTQGKIIQNAKVSVYTLEKTTNRYVLWESATFSQTNPQLTDENGNYRFILPPGKFYLQVEAKNKSKLRTNIFEIYNPTPINQIFTMNNSSFWNLWWSEIVNYKAAEINSTYNSESSLLNKPIPDFDLGTENTIFSNLSILGKPTLITFFTSWDPISSDQIKELDLLKKENQGLNVAAVDIQESSSKANIFKKIGDYSIDIVADPDGVFVLPFSLKSLPAHIFIDKKGIIKSVQDGYVSKSNLLQEILK